MGEKADRLRGRARKIEQQEREREWRQRAAERQRYLDSIEPRDTYSVGMSSPDPDPEDLRPTAFVNPGSETASNWRRSNAAPSATDGGRRRRSSSKSKSQPRSRPQPRPRPRPTRSRNVRAATIDLPIAGSVNKDVAVVVGLILIAILGSEAGV